MEGLPVHLQAALSEIPMALWTTVVHHLLRVRDDPDLRRGYDLPPCAVRGPGVPAGG